MGKHSKTLGILVMPIMVTATIGGCGSTSKSSVVKSIKVAVVWYAPLKVDRLNNKNLLLKRGVVLCLEKLNTH